MHKVITSDFEINLQDYQFSVVEENFWFSDSFFTKYSFPFELDLEKERFRKLLFLLDHNYSAGRTFFECVYVLDDKMEKAVFEIESITGFRVSASLRYGFDDLPSFDKKLSELSLDKFELPEGNSIYDYAGGVISQTWPEVNFNFPQVHIDKIDTEDSEVWFAFEKIINNYKNGAMLINEVDVDDVTYNRNIIQPLPYYLHILQRGFLDAGKTLMGDVLNDEHFKKKCLYADVNYATTVEQTSIPMMIFGADYDYIFDSSRHFFLQADVPNPGRYRVQVTINFPGQTVYPQGKHIIIKYRNQIIWQYHHNSSVVQFGDHVITVGPVFDTISDLNPNTVSIEVVGGSVGDDHLLVDGNVNPVRLHDDQGNAIPTVINQNKVDLTRAVPEMTFRDFVKYLRNKYNLDLDVRGSEVWMNFIQNELHNSETVDLTRYEVPARELQRKFNMGVSFVLTYGDVDTDEYTFSPVFHSKDEISNVLTNKDDKTNEIVLDGGLPLPLLVRNGVQTAHAFESGTQKLYTVMYDGLTNGLNLSKDPSAIMLPAVHERHYKDWFNGRIDAANYMWNFRMSPEARRKLKAKSKVYAYGRNHLVKVLNKSQTKPDVWEVEIETETLR